MVKIFLNGKKILEKDFNPNDTLDKIRENIFNSLVFTDENGKEIDISDESELTLNDIIRNKDKMNLNFKIQSKSINKNNPISGTKLLENKGKLKIYQYPNERLNDSEESSSINILLVGETDSGKTSLLNSFINVLMDIQITDDFRYKLSQDTKETDSINIYNIKPHGNIPAIKIIDSPGFGSSKGIDEDIKFRDKLANTLKNSISHINAICLVIKSSTARLTVNQIYIFSMVLDLFGKDVQENFFFMLTFCDGAKPQVVSALESKESGFNEIISQIKGNWFYKFNNSAFFSDDIENEFVQVFWKISKNSFHEFLKKSTQTQRKSLSQTNEVLKIRQSLENDAKNISNKLKKGLDLMKLIKQNLSMNENKKEFINITKDCLNIQEQIRNSVNKLKNIALSYNNYAKYKEMIELLIMIEKEEKRQYWTERVKQYEDTKNQYKILKEICEGNLSDIKSLEQFKKEII